MMKPTQARSARAAACALALTFACGSTAAASAPGGANLPSHQTQLDANGVGFDTAPPGLRPVNKLYRSRFRHARPSYEWRHHGSKQELLGFTSQIQHVVVIYMENRTPENLFGAYASTINPTTGNSFAQDLGVIDPTLVAQPQLSPAPLYQPGTDADHSHEPGFVNDAAGAWGPVASHFVPADGEVQNYLTLIENWAYANTVLQSNEGPSFESHQYAISGQSGGLHGSSIYPYGMFENPNPAPPLDVPATASDDAVVGSGTCFAGSSRVVPSADMRTAYPGTENQKPNPCNEYPTILDETVGSQGTPPYDDWQYVAYNDDGIWAAPMSINHLFAPYQAALNNNATWSQPFAVDRDAENFVLNVTTNGRGNPPRPFAALTYLTPCVAESDHPNDSRVDDGPEWLAYVLNGIGASAYWKNTAVIVTWDDWGGFYDNYSPAPWPFHPGNNPYGPNLQDPNEWGFRVPLMVISPWVTRRGYISTTRRSQGAILNFIENAFSLGTLGGDDKTNGTDDLSDMFDFAQSSPGLPWIPFPASATFKPTYGSRCPHAR